MDVNREKEPTGPYTKEHLAELKHDLANRRIVINYSAWMLNESPLSAEDYQTNQEMLARNGQATIALLANIRLYLLEVDKQPKHEELFTDLTASVNKLLVQQPKEHLTRFEDLSNRLVRVLNLY